MKKIQYYQLLKEEWVPDEEPIQKQETKKDLAKSPSLLTSVLIGLIIVECMLGAFLVLR